MSGGAFEVVIVPDFVAKGTVSFEARTLFFLASWLECVRPAKNLSLHVACIGEPPPSVVWLAERCGAAISVHAPVGWSNQCPNKLRGLEIEGRSSRRLLVDVDVLLLRDPEGLISRIDPHAISALPVEVPAPIAPHWQRLCAVATELAHPVSYYQTAVVYFGSLDDVRELWERHIRASATFLRTNFETDSPAWKFWSDDSPGFAMMMGRLKAGGIVVQALPVEFHGRPGPLYGGQPRLRDLVLFHAMRSFVGFRDVSDACRHGVWRYRKALVSRTIGSWRIARDRSGKTREEIVHRLCPAIGDIVRLTRYMRRLRNRYVLPARAATERGALAERNGAT
jgi:hypothetical protein